MEMPIKALASVNDDVLPEDFPSDAEIRYVEISDVSEGQDIRWQEPSRFGDAPSRARRRVQNGDLLVSTVRTYLRAVAGVRNAPDGAIVSTGFAVLRPSNVQPKFLEYAMLNTAVLDQIVARSVGVSYPAINASDLVTIKIQVPPREAQVHIVSLLDRETAEIDAFIADQEELIGLLAERRAATISHAVTKGLDPTVPMQDSGIEWLGKIPAHWNAGSVRRLSPNNESGTSVNGYQAPAGDGEVGVLKTGSASKGYFDPLENKRVLDEELERVTVPARKGALLINRANTPELVGAGAYIDRDAPQLYLSDKLWQLDFTSGENAFVYYWTRSEYYRAQIRAMSVGASASMQNLSFPDFLSLRIAYPGISEQRNVVMQLDAETRELDLTIRDAQMAIVLSRERRAALISAAVTGKIDVREHGVVA